jgi:hypothetical protein
VTTVTVHDATVTSYLPSLSKTVTVTTSTLTTLLAEELSTTFVTQTAMTPPSFLAEMRLMHPSAVTVQTQVPVFLEYAACNANHPLEHANGGNVIHYYTRISEPSVESFIVEGYSPSQFCTDFIQRPNCRVTVVSYISCLIYLSLNSAICANRVQPLWTTYRVSPNTSNSQANVIWSNGPCG